MLTRSLLFGVISLSAAHGPTVKVNALPNLARNEVMKLLGKPKSTADHKKFGLMDLYKLPGFVDARFSYIEENGKLQPYSARFTLPREASFAEALKSVGVDSSGAAVHRSTVDGSTVVDKARGLIPGWKLSYWKETAKPNRTHIDFQSPDHHS